MIIIYNDSGPFVYNLTYFYLILQRAQEELNDTKLANTNYKYVKHEGLILKYLFLIHYLLINVYTLLAFLHTYLVQSIPIYFTFLNINCSLLMCKS